MNGANQSAGGPAAAGATLPARAPREEQEQRRPGFRVRVGGVQVRGQGQRGLEVCCEKPPDTGLKPLPKGTLLRPS